MFRDVYVAELDYLQQLLDELGREQPQIAPMLGRSADPGTTRLAQNLAFLFARLRQRLDDDLPEVIHPVLDGLCPWMLRPLPGATVLELSPEPSLREAAHVAAGCAFGSKPVEGVQCIFQSTLDVTVLPWSLDRVEVSVARDEIVLGLAVNDGAAVDLAATGGTGGLRLFLAMPTAMALDVRSLLLRDGVELSGRVPGRAGEIVLARGAGACVFPCAAPRLPEIEPRPAEAPELLQLRAYFAWPAHLGLIETASLAPLAELGADPRRIELVIRLARPLPRAYPFDARQVRLHATPAVNVHRLQSHNLPLAAGRCALTGLPGLTPARAGAEVYAIAGVTLVRADLASERAEPWARFFPPRMDDAGRATLRYEVHRVPSVLGTEVDVSLTFAGLEERGAAGARGGLSVDVDLLVHDGPRAARLAIGDVCVPVTASPSRVGFRNVTPVTRHAAPQLEGDRMWRWFQLLKATLPQLCDTEHLARTLALVNVAAWARWPEAKPDAERFAPLLAVRCDRAKRAERDEVVPGARVEIRVDTQAFTGPGDVDAFGESLVPLLTGTLRSHEWLELVVADAGGAPLFTYPARYGTRPGL
jgi:type VI secretion system protein ImpG